MPRGRSKIAQMAIRVAAAYHETHYENLPEPGVVFDYTYHPYNGGIPRRGREVYPNEVRVTKSFTGKDAHLKWIESFHLKRRVPTYMVARKVIPNDKGGPPKETVLMEWDNLDQRTV